MPAGNPYGSYVGSPPGDGYSARPAPELNGHRGAPYPAASDQEHSAPYPPAQEQDRYRDGSYPPAASPDSHREWYPQPSASPLPREGNGAAGPGQSEFEAPATGRHSGDGYYYPPGYRPSGYPSARPGQEGYLPSGGYPGAPPVPHAQDPYAPDGYGRQAGY